MENIQNIQQKCENCHSPFDGLWMFGWREGVLEKLVEEYKYQSVRAMGGILVELYDMILPQELVNTRQRHVCRHASDVTDATDDHDLIGTADDRSLVEDISGRGSRPSPDVVIVPLPTIGKHIRERGFDHTLTIAKKLAKLRGWRCQQILTRAVDTVQVGSKMSERKTQARKAYAVRGKIDPNKHYLLLDDVWTTGATMLAAEKVLRAAGAERISAVVLAVSKLKTD